MSANVTTAQRPGSLAPLLVAQFLSAFADNALLFGAVALLQAGAYPAWTTPALQQCFVAAYILLAPFAGQIAEVYSKRQVLIGANAVKLCGALSISLGFNPFLAYGLVGAGAAAYSPAKYGILGELLTAQHLVRANGLLEASTIVAILTGALAGGVMADHSVSLLLWLTCGAYGFAWLAAQWIAPVAARNPAGGLKPGPLVRQFFIDVDTLARDTAARTSLLGTSLFWGAGATLRLLLIAWVPVALLRTDATTPAALSAVVAIGIAIGAGCAARWIRLGQGFAVLPVGALLGGAVVGLAGVESLPAAVALLLVVGTAGGFYVVPLNAILQHRGHAAVGAGPAIAVQNLWENATMLVLLGAYTLASASSALTPEWIVALFGGALMLAMLALWRANGKAAA